MEERVILHSDFNSFYANIECLYDPSLRNRPMAVTGNVQKRHGIVLSKNEPAKKCGVKTGEVLWQAKKKCPDIVFITARHSLYTEISKKSREIYLNTFSSQVEPFGLDECWLDVSGSLLGNGREIADKIRKTMRDEMGLTVSVGVSFNKVFAKLGSDIKKPDATTVITRENFKDTIWKLPVNKLLYVGPATYRKLKRYWICTIGDLAQADPEFLYLILGKNGVMLWHFANGRDNSAVTDYYNSTPVIKSVGNSTTTPTILSPKTRLK